MASVSPGAQPHTNNPVGLLHRRARKDRAGAALVAALIVVTVVAVISLAYLELSMAKTREQRGSVDAKRAFYMAEAGLSEAFAALSVGLSGNIANSLIPAQYANGLFWVEETAGADGRLQLKSTGMCGSGRTSISVVVEPVKEELGALGVFGGARVHVGPGSTIDAFDSRPGAAGTPSARVGSNGDIALDASRNGPPTRVDGDVVPGPSGAVLRGTGVTVSGVTAPRTEEQELPGVELPALPQQADVQVPARAKALVEGDGHYGSIRVLARGSLTLRGPAQIVVDQLIVDADGKIEVDAKHGAVTVFVSDRLDFAPQSTYFSKDMDPSRVRIFVTGGSTRDRDGDGVEELPVNLGAAGDLWGSFYAPNARVYWPSTLELHGSLAAADLVVEAGSRLHFDVALLDVPAMSKQGGPQRISWRIVDVPVTELTGLRIDPLLVLELSGVTPPKAKNAHYRKGQDPKAGVTPPGLAKKRTAL